jgi:hypothetical protein
MRRFLTLGFACFCLSTAAFITSVWADDGESEEGGGETTINDLCTLPSTDCNNRGSASNGGLMNACHLGAAGICGNGVNAGTNCNCVTALTSTISRTDCFCEVK